MSVQSVRQGNTWHEQELSWLHVGAIDEALRGVLTADPRTGRIPQQTILAYMNRLLRANVGPSTRGSGSRPSQAYKEVPVEIWLLIFKDMAHADLLNLSRVSSYIGAVAESLLYREAKLRPLAVKTWTATVSRSLDNHRATAVRSLTISLDGVVGLSKSANALLRLAGALSSLPDLRELTIVGANPHKDAVRNILPDIAFSRLKKFACNSDALVLASWSALAAQSELEEFRGMYDYASYIPMDVAPGVWPKLRILDAGATFVERITGGSKVTCLSVHVPRATAKNVLARISLALGDRLIALRVVRTILCPHSGGSDWVAAHGEPYWESDSPVFLCAALHAPVLSFFELQDRLPEAADVDWTTDLDTLRERGAFGSAFRTAQRKERTPALITILWRPVWADAACLFPGPAISRDHVLDMFALLPVRYVGMPLVQSVRKTPGMKGWSLWERMKVSEGAPPPPPWWEDRGTVLQKNGYAPLEELWANEGDTSAFSAIQ